VKARSCARVEIEIELGKVLSCIESPDVMQALPVQPKKEEIEKS
jgi:hypothetical protein